MRDRYDTVDNPEDEYYTGPSVLTNLEDIRDPVDLSERETELQFAAYDSTKLQLHGERPATVLCCLARHNVQPYEGSDRRGCSAACPITKHSSTN
jgi:hypothetical protein